MVPQAPRRPGEQQRKWEGHTLQLSRGIERAGGGYLALPSYSRRRCGIMNSMLSGGIRPGTLIYGLSMRILRRENALKV